MHGGQTLYLRLHGRVKSHIRRSIIGPSSNSRNTTRAVRIGGLILAAGQGRRFGGDKLFATFHGRVLLSHVLETVSAARARALLTSIHAVVAKGDEPLTELVRKSDATPVVNDEPVRGLASSLGVGLGALSPDLDAALVLLGDQPLVRLDVIERLVQAWARTPSTVLRPRYELAPDVPGHPVLLAREAWPLAGGLEGDRGFGRRFAPGAPGVSVIEVPGDNPDVDTPADLLALEERR